MHTVCVVLKRSPRAVAALSGLMVLAACGQAPAVDQSARSTSPRAWLGTAVSAAAHTGPLPVGTGWGPTEPEIERARRIVGRLSLQERAGQVIVARYAGTGAPTALVNGLHLGGVVVFSANYTGTDQIRRSNRALQRSAAAAGRRFPVVIGVDQEGGLVERVTGGTRFPAFMTAGAAGSTELTRAAAAGSGRELAGLGFTTDYAPVADVTVGPRDPTVGSRSASSRPAVVAEQVVAAAGGFATTGVVPTVKHFPGHGSVTANSHVTLPVQRKTVRQLRRSDLVPFRAAVEAGLPSIMVGHIDVRAVDPGTPSSLSRPVVTGLLRKDLGFDGLVVTDSLEMRAVSDRWGSGAAAVRALRAGADVVLMPPSPRDARDGIVRAVRQGRLSSQRLIQAATRQVALLLHQKKQGMTTAAPGSGRQASYRWSAAAVTSVSGPCGGRLVGKRVKVTGDPVAVARFRAAATAAGLKVVPKRGTTVRLIGRGGPAATGDVVVATDLPYPLGSSRAPARIATYGSTPGAMRALVDVLLGRADAPGLLPVPVRGADRRGC